MVRRPTGTTETGPRFSASSRADREAFSVRFREAYRTLWLIASGIVGNRALADDVVQEAALIALGKLDQFTEGTSFKAWMGQIVRFVALNFARRHRRDRHDDLPADAQDRTSTAGSSPLAERKGASPHSALQQLDLDDELLNAMRALSETACACLLLRTVDGMDYREISELLDIPEGTAMSHVHRSRMFLRQRLSAGGAADRNMT